MWVLTKMQAFVRSLHAPHNLALVRRFALNILNCLEGDSVAVTSTPEEIEEIMMRKELV